MTCEECATWHPTVSYCLEERKRLCGHCFSSRGRATCVDGPQATRASTTPRRDVPRSSSLVPCATTREAPPEVDQLLLLHEDGKFDPLPVVLPELPSTATMPMRKVAEFYVLVQGLRLAAGDEREVPFAVRWVGGHLGLPHRTVARALSALAHHGVLDSAGAMPGREGRRGTGVWTPGGSVEHPAATGGAVPPILPPRTLNGFGSEEAGVDAFAAVETTGEAAA